MKQLNWATLGCGVIANQLAEAMQAKGRTLYSVANRTHQKAVEFANKYKIEKVYDSIDEVFEDENGQDYLKKFVHLGSESNAFTSFTKTSYLFSTTSKVPENIQLLLEMVSKASFTEKSVSKEREIIQQEIGMYQDSPDYRLFFGALENLYPGTPLADDIAGTRESISNITINNLRENFDLFYHPSQMHLLVIGNFDVCLLYTSDAADEL